MGDDASRMVSSESDSLNLKAEQEAGQHQGLSELPGVR